MRLTRRIVITQTLLALVSIAAAQPENTGAQQSLEGAWNVTINYAEIPPCKSAPAVFTREGTIIADSCSLFLGAGYGSWRRTGNREFASTFIGNIYGPDGSVTGSYKVRAAGSLDRSGDLANGVFKTEIFAPSGNVTAVLTGTVTLKRIQVEPL
jgi:hypothetical protein